MNFVFKKFYDSLDADMRHVYKILALSPKNISVSELLSYVNVQVKITAKRLREILEHGKQMNFIRCDYRDSYLLDSNILVWLYPLIEGLEKEKAAITARNRLYSFYYGFSNKTLLEYLEALLHNTKDLKRSEEEMLRSPYLIEKLLTIFHQPLYENVYSRITPKILEKLYHAKTTQSFLHLDSLEALHQLGVKLSAGDARKSITVNIEQAQIEYRRGNWEDAKNLVRAVDCHVAYFTEASMCFAENDYNGALSMFEKGMKKQRRDYKQSFLPVIPEAALYYLVALTSGEQDSFIPLLGRITDPKTKIYTITDNVFVKLCNYMISNNTETYSEWFKTVTEHDCPEMLLWKIIGLGFTGEKPYEYDKWVKKGLQILKTALASDYLPAVYEAAYVLKNMESKEAAEIFAQLSDKLKYAPALSRIKRVEEWEKQINAYLSLEAVKTIVRQENDDGKTRIAYRFYPNRGNAFPVLQTRQANGGWTAGRNIAMTNFINGKVDGMSEQDKRIAAANSYYTYSLEKYSIVEMTGHPNVFLENSDIYVELVAAKPVLSVVESSRGGYKLESDVTDLRSDVYIKKETNTRYIVYSIGKQQREIIEAVKKGRKIPEAGKEKLLKVLELFSSYLTVQTDLTGSDVSVQTRYVETDSRVRVQLLPLGDGLKAELFVKPFGSHPPYSKPGKGGKVLMANHSGERLQVTRNMDLEIQYSDRILTDLQTIESIEINEGVMTFTDPHDALELLDILKQHSEIAIVEWPEGERMKVRYSANFENLKLRMKSGVDWFELEGELQLDEETVISIAQLLKLVKHGRGRFIELSDGEFISLSKKFKRRLDELSAFSNISKDSATINRFASASIADSFDDFENMKIDKAWRDFRKRLQESKNINSAIPSALKAELRPYQEEGYRWMTRLAAWGAGACLADDMGLGKTVQAIAILLQRVAIGPALIVSPVSVQHNWISEINRFAPSLTVKTLQNTGDREETLASLDSGDLLVTSYGLLQSEEEALAAREWATVVLDEAHAIKNYNTKTSKAAMSLKAGFRIILTGTPLQNHLGEIWNLFQFINPGLLGSLSHFSDNYIKPDDDTARKRLKKLISPFILRRTKSAVLDELPPKTEIIRKIELSHEEMSFYEALRRRAIESLQKDDSPQGAKHLKALAEITRLRQACCNPKLVEPQIDLGSTKMQTFMEIAAELKDNGHRALVFSQFVTHLTIVRSELDRSGFTYQYLDGSTTPVKREIAVRKFQAGEGDLFLISLKAGGLGLNLTAADFVIHLDPWWNPAVEDQASDRAHRIGQSRPVTVYRLVAENTIEEKIIRLHNTKRDLADSLLEGADMSAKLSMDELMALIREV